MRSIRSTAFAITMTVVALSASPGARAMDHASREPGRHLVVTNATSDSITGLAIAPEGTDAWRAIDLGEPLQGGETSITIDIPRGDCLRSVRITFRNGYSQGVPHVDVCSSQHLRLTTGTDADPDRIATANR